MVGEPPLPVRVLGRALTGAIARWPRLWPLLRRPVRSFFDRVAPDWDVRVRPDEPGRMAPLEAALEDLEAPPRRILDLGTGTGAAALYLARRFPAAEVHGVDISEPMVAAARAKLTPELAERVDFAAADAAALPFPDAHFDLVVQVSVPAFFDETVRVLAPGGRVAIVSSLGPRTPFHTPERLLRRRFASRGLRELRTGEAGRGTYFVAEKAP